MIVPFILTGLKIVYHQDFAPPDTPISLAFAPPLPYYKHYSTQTLLLISGEAPVQWSYTQGWHVISCRDTDKQ